MLLHVCSLHLCFVIVLLHLLFKERTVIVLGAFFAEWFPELGEKGVLAVLFSVEVEWAVFWVGKD